MARYFSACQDFFAGICQKLCRDTQSPLIPQEYSNTKVYNLLNMSQPSGVPAGQFNTRISNFTAGPGALPVPVLEQCQREMLNWNNCGASVMEYAIHGEV